MPTKRKSTDDDEPSQSYDPQPASKKPRTAPRRQAKGKDKATCEGDNGRSTTAKRSIHPPKPNGKNYGEEAKRYLQSRSDELCVFIGKKHEEKRSNPNIGKALRVSLPADIAPVMAHGYAAKQSEDDGRNLTAELSATLMKEMGRTIKLYAEDAGNSSGVSKPEWMRWQTDCRDLHSFNKNAMTMAEQLVHSMIVPGGKAGVPKLPEKADEVEAVAWELYDAVRPTSTETTWGRMAQGMLKAFAGVLKTKE
ncbi:uncharacterized protein F5Z01DRAFT_645849 [Emericellopsis atlantica]|uniref:Uncharacterized protein n=1 Tax=Emericellopsis atlantica TaxID=2614577 RepID=A0A9P7ZTI9_9HYPO|nr:uncharacterized protein F5Z01DRAFT_645849 [Emericellopsis atlantica]KAG9257405.1 hypothetical protein F5Z01DRAFT_645849 [Emericellopsis atlantica]